jgi:putative transposase
VARTDRLRAEGPFFGPRKLAPVLSTPTAPVSRKRVQRLMRVVARKPGTVGPVPGRGHEVRPYLLRNVSIARPDRAWGADSTYTPMPPGFVYLAATIDGFRRPVVSWRRSNALDGAFGQEVLDEALGRGTPEVFSTDQGVPFTARAWTGRSEGAGVAVSTDGKGRCPDNIFVGRLWGSATYAYARPCGPETVLELGRGLTDYFGFYNDRRVHQSPGHQAPPQVHRSESRRPLEK